MPHLDEGQLAALFDNELEPDEKRAAETHLASCAECRALWDQTRDFAGEADRLVAKLEPPPLNRPKPAIVTTPPAPNSAATPRRLLPWRTVAWAASVLCAVGLGYSLRSAARDTTDMAGALPTSQPIPAERADKAMAPGTAATGAPTGASAEAAPAATRDERPAPAEMANAGKVAAAPPAAAPTQPTAPAMDAVTQPAAGGSVALSQPEAEPRAARNLAAPKRTASRLLTMEEAVRTLAGSIRLVDGLEPVKLLAIPGGILVPGEPGQETIRVVYEDPPGRELWLDQQRPTRAAESARARSAESLLPGDTLITPAEGGGKSLRWIDQNGFILRLTGFLPGDSLRAIVSRVH